MGGEEIWSKMSIWSSSGLPPRGRGRAEGAGAFGFGLGITPAWAGKRPAPAWQAGVHKDYPRVGGEEGGTRSGKI